MSRHALHSLDLNLLLALDVLLAERSVSEAAARVGVSQPAMSQTLARLRRMFDDPLLVRSGNRMEPTALADRLREPLHVLLGQLDTLVNDQGQFDPGTSQRTLRMAALDHFSALCLPRIMSDIETDAPGVRVEVSRLSYRSVEAELDQGTIDVAVGVFRRTSPSLRQTLLHREHFRCVMRTEHPALADWTLVSYLASHHALLATAGREEGAVDALLARRGLFRTVRLRVPHFLAAGHLAESTDLIVTAPGRLAEDLARRHDLTAVDPPFDIPGYELTMQWHRRHDGDVAHEWLRGRIEAATR